MPSWFHCASYIKVFNFTGSDFAVRMQLVGLLGEKEWGLIIVIGEAALKDNRRE